MKVINVLSRETVPIVNHTHNLAQKQQKSLLVARRRFLKTAISKEKERETASGIKVYPAYLSQTRSDQKLKSTQNLTLKVASVALEHEPKPNSPKYVRMGALITAFESIMKNNHKSSPRTNEQKQKNRSMSTAAIGGIILLPISYETSRENPSEFT